MGAGSPVDLMEVLSGTAIVPSDPASLAQSTFTQCNHCNNLAEISYLSIPAVGQCTCSGVTDPFLEFCHQEGVFWVGFDDVTVGGSSVCDLAYEALGLSSDPSTNGAGQSPSYSLNRALQIWSQSPLGARARRLDISDLDGAIWYSVTQGSSMGIYKLSNNLSGSPGYYVVSGSSCGISKFGDIDTGLAKTWWVGGSSSLNTVYSTNLNIAGSYTPTGGIDISSITSHTGATIRAIAVDKVLDVPVIALDSGTTGGSTVWKLTGTGSNPWTQVSGILALDISLGNDGTTCWVSNEPAFSGSADYKIYTLNSAGVKQQIGAGVNVDCWNQYQVIYSDSLGLSHVLSAVNPEDIEHC